MNTQPRSNDYFALKEEIEKLKGYLNYRTKEKDYFVSVIAEMQKEINELRKIKEQTPFHQQKIVDFLNSNGIKSDFETRKKIFEQVYYPSFMGVTIGYYKTEFYEGTEDQNEKIVFLIDNNSLLINALKLL